MRAKAYFLAITVSLATLGAAQAQRVLGPMEPAAIKAQPPAAATPAPIPAAVPVPGGGAIPLKT